MKEPCSRVADVTPHPGTFEMQILKALAHLHDASETADKDNRVRVARAIGILREACRSKELAAKVLCKEYFGFHGKHLPLRVVAPQSPARKEQ